MIKIGWFILRSTVLSIRLKLKGVVLLLRNPSMKLGDRVEVKSCQFGKYNYLASDTRLSKVEMGDFSYCSTGTKIVNTKVGAFTCIGPSVTIGLASHSIKKTVSLHPAFYSSAAQVGFSFVKNVHFDEGVRTTKIGSDVWIGANVTIPGGITIGHGAVVASGAVVTKDVEPYSIMAGVPAKKIDSRFSKEHCDALLKIKWWEWSFEKLSEYSNKMLEVDRFIHWTKEDRPI